MFVWIVGPRRTRNARSTHSLQISKFMSAYILASVFQQNLLPAARIKDSSGL